MTNGEKIEQLIICLEYFEVLPESLHSLDELYQLIENNISKTKEKNHMYEVIYKYEEIQKRKAR